MHLKINWEVNTGILNVIAFMALKMPGKCTSVSETVSHHARYVHTKLAKEGVVWARKGREVHKPSPMWVCHITPYGVEEISVTISHMGKARWSSTKYIIYGWEKRGTFNETPCMGRKE